MKNLKKVLALVLVVASLMGLATMASATTSEDYSDGESISHIEAVDVMSTIGVFDGISGAFSGDSILTREQAAKIITYMILGKEDADALVASVAPYTDVSRDRWSAGSIAYCKNEGILAGVGNGRFEPDGKLTGVAFAKMCLVALGYDPDVEKLTGPQWAVNTSSLAIAGAGISANLSQISMADEMSREDACQMAFNTLKADLVDYDDRGTNIVIPNGDGKDIVISDAPSKARPVEAKTSQVGEDKKSYNNINEDGFVQFGERYFPKLNNRGTDHDSFGRPATTWHYKSEEIGTYVDNSQLIQSWTAKAPKGEMHSAIGGSIVDNLGVKNGYTFKAYVDGTMGGTLSDYKVSQDARADYFVKNSTAAAGKPISSYKDSNIGKSGNGVLTELYMNDDDDVRVVMINTYLVQATADYNTVNQRVNIEAKPIDDNNTVPTNFLPTYISNDDFDVTGVKDGDYLLLTVSFNNEWGVGGNNCSIESVTPATIQTGTVTEYTENDDVTVGGTKYSYNRILGENEKGEEFAIDSDATLVLDTYGYIMYVDEAVTSSNFVYIDNYGSTSGLSTNPRADAYFTDGTNNEIGISKVDGVKDKSAIINKYRAKAESDNEKDSGDEKGYNFVKGENHAFARWYTFTGSSGGQYTLTTPNTNRYDDQHFVLTKAGQTGDLIKNGSVKFLSGISGLDEYVVIKDADKSDSDKPYKAVSADTNDTKATAKTVKANDKTIFVIKDQNDDVTSYTGIANVPDVAIGDKHTGHAKVSWICKKGSEYASYVFVDASLEDMEVDEVSTTADYMFVLKATNNRTHVNGLDYFKYTVVIDGKEEERWVSETIFDGKKSDAGTLWYNVKEDSNGRIKDAKQVGNGSKTTHLYANLEVSGSYIEQDGNTLTISALKDAEYKVGNDTKTKGNGDLIANSKSEINLVIGPKADGDLWYDTGADYETHMGVSASFVGSFLNDYKENGSKVNDLQGRVYVILDDDADKTELIKTMWLYIGEAVDK